MYLIAVVITYSTLTCIRAFVDIDRCLKIWRSWNKFRMTWYSWLPLYKLVHYIHACLYAYSSTKKRTQENISFCSLPDINLTDIYEWLFLRNEVHVLTCVFTDASHNFFQSILSELAAFHEELEFITSKHSQSRLFERCDGCGAWFSSDECDLSEKSSRLQYSLLYTFTLDLYTSWLYEVCCSVRWCSFMQYDRSSTERSCLSHEEKVFYLFSWTPFKDIEFFQIVMHRIILFSLFYHRR